VDAGKYTYRVVHMSTLMRQKGALVFIEAIPRVIALRRDVEFILVGPWANDADKKWAEDFIKETGIGDHVRFTGPLTGKAKFDLLRSCDLFVFPGIQQEGQPLVVLEAMAVGLPVLFSARGCLRETVIEGLTGKEIKVNDPSDLAIKILWLLDHPDEMKRMGLNSKTRHENMYSIGHHIEALTQTLTTALSL
jgi:glycosyltransferase involved in cell wall biosynthesis